MNAKEKPAGTGAEDKSRQRLGRGLAALIGGGGATGAALRPAATGGGSGGERSVATAMLRANPNNPRRHFDEADLADLAASIRTHGVVQPILVRPAAGEGAGFEIVAGERRWRAAQLAELAQVPVVVRTLTDRETLEIAIIENVQRADLDPLEEAQAYEMLMVEHGYRQVDLADALGKSRSHVANTLRLLKLPESVRRMVSSGELSPGHARAAVTAEDPEAFARDVARQGLTVRETEQLSRKENAKPAPRRANRPATPAPAAGPAPAEPKRAEVEYIESFLSETLGMPVAVEPPNEGATLRISYGTPEKLAELVRLLKLAGEHRSGPRVRQL
ncbi:ParB/RepB/Spo0J family partition protein [Aureimonas leprariae]|uniref:ParB/RepB/Spo0J family partition protein n=2 Tax=Plantimonas leprariae TaxID=2615207 RepID=A0A7V7TZJ1_9HYPH|nr:ParB/RepB/Spo0J family partition protein [Aureimonas leprariae]